MIDAATGGGHDPHDGAGGLGQRPRRVGEDLLQRRREAGAPLPGLGQHQLLDEERVAIRTAVEARRDHPEGASPVMEASIAAVSSASRRARSIRLTRPVRSSSLIHGIAGCRRWSSSDRRVIATTTGSVRRVRTRNPRVSRVAGSAQWTSSTMTSTGEDSDRRRSRPATRFQEACLQELALDVGGRRRRVECGHEAGEVSAGRPDEGQELTRLRAPARPPRGSRRSGRMGAPDRRRWRTSREGRARRAPSLRRRAPRRAASCRRRPRP